MNTFVIPNCFNQRNSKAREVSSTSQLFLPFSAKAAASVLSYNFDEFYSLFPSCTFLPSLLKHRDSPPLALTVAHANWVQHGECQSDQSALCCPFVSTRDWPVAAVAVILTYLDKSRAGVRLPLCSSQRMSWAAWQTKQHKGGKMLHSSGKYLSCLLALVSALQCTSPSRVVVLISRQRDSCLCFLFIWISKILIKIQCKADLVYIRISLPFNF